MMGFVSVVITITGIGFAKEATSCIGIVDWNPLPERLVVVIYPLILSRHHRQYPADPTKKFSEAEIECHFTQKYHLPILLFCCKKFMVE
jgi:hypothetical protein